ncbi:hypothetical protein Tco_0034102 [Tanacetum coccineum]
MIVARERHMAELNRNEGPIFALVTRPVLADGEESKGEEEKMVPDKADNMMQVQRNTLRLVERTSDGIQTDRESYPREGWYILLSNLARGPCLKLRSTASVILAFHVEHSSNVATPIQRASNVQSVIRRFLDEGTKESGFVNIEGFSQTSVGAPVISGCQQWTHLNLLLLVVGGTASDVEKNSSDCGKRKLTTYEDSDVFETYSQLSARNVRPRFSSDLPQASSVNTSQPMYNEVILTTLVLQFQTNVKEHARTLKEDHQHMKQRAQKEYATLASTTTNMFSFDVTWLGLFFVKFVVGGIWIGRRFVLSRIGMLGSYLFDFLPVSSLF